MRTLLLTTFAILGAFGQAFGQETCLQDVIETYQWERADYSSLQQAQDTLLQRYAEFKQYGQTDPARVRQRLSPDRLMVFDATTRAMFTRLRRGDLHTRRIRTYDKIVDYIYAVTGIWGVRLHDDDGSRAFRLTVVADPEFTALLKDTRGTTGETFRPVLARFAHILIPFCQPNRGDDDPNNTSWLRPPARELRTVRQVGVWPKMQISYWDQPGYRHVLEIDVDFYNGGNPVFNPHDFQCHQTPSNSDPGMADHPSALQGRYASVFPFTMPFSATCAVERMYLCQEVYRTYCQNRSSPD